MLQVYFNYLVVVSFYIRVEILMTRVDYIKNFFSQNSPSPPRINVFLIFINQDTAVFLIISE